MVGGVRAYFGCVEFDRIPGYVFGDRLSGAVLRVRRRAISVRESRPCLIAVATSECRVFQAALPVSDLLPQESLQEITRRA